MIDHEVVAVCERDPAHVIGDGKSTIYELVQLKNMKKEIDRIQLEQKELENIKPYTISSIPKENEKVYLRKNSNISTGGDAIDKTEEIDSKFKEIAVEAAKILRARICGVDMIIDKDQYSIIEMNYNPTITIHHAPFAGKSIPVAKTY